MRVSTHSAANKGIPSQKNRNAITWPTMDHRHFLRT
jgi:hypothetical protein